MFDKLNSTFIIAELSANHNGSLEKARQTLYAAAEAGANAIKLQTYKADTITIDCDNEYFQIKGTQWAGKTLYELYQEAYTPWEWHAELFNLATSLGMIAFSTPFDSTAVDFLENLKVPCFKIASFELIDTPLLRKIGSTKKPVIMSTGMASLAEIDEALQTLRAYGTTEITLLKCTSAYPAQPEEMNLATIPDMKKRFNLNIGISDHTLEIAIPAAAVVLGATIIEKHLTLSRSDPGPDSGFSLEPAEFRAMVKAVRAVEKSIGLPTYGTTAQENTSRAFRKSLFVVKDIQEGERFTSQNIRSIRPGDGLPPNNWDRVMRGKARCDIRRGIPLDETMILNDTKRKF